MGIEMIHHQCDSFGLWKGLINQSPDFVSPLYRFMIISHLNASPTDKDGETKNRYPRSKLTGYYAIFSFGPFAFKAYRSKLRGIKPREIKWATPLRSYSES